MRGEFAWAIGLSLWACSSPEPPPNWARGSSPIDLPNARWYREHDGAVVDLLADGRVFVDNDHWFTVDHAGRIFEPDHEPIAILAPDGQLLGKNGVSLGFVGLRNAALPGQRNAWIALDERGEVHRYEPDGESQRDGAWTGCGAALRACTVTTHLVSLLEAERRPRVGVGFGFGVMLGR
jgi:hypothetical protein